jgi:ADP-ribosylglycohydrolase
LAAARGEGSITDLGEGWAAEEALAMAVHAALALPGPDQVLDALSLAVSHGGDSDSTGAICGNLLGAWHGDTALPAVLAFEVEGRGTILQLADDLVWEFTVPEQLHGDYGPFTRWTSRY